MNRDELIKSISESMGVKIVSWDIVDETIDNDIDFSMIVDSSSYVSKEDRVELNQKCHI